MNLMVGMVNFLNLRTDLVKRIADFLNLKIT